MKQQYREREDQRDEDLPSIIDVPLNIPVRDSRGFFLNLYRGNEALYQNIWGNRNIKQINMSHTLSVGAVRGMHLQTGHSTEAKLVRCIRGRVWDVGLDLREKSSNYGQWHGAELTPNNGQAMFIPEGCAHGFQALEANTELLYIHSGEWVKTAESGVRYDSPWFNIDWPLPVTELSERDKMLPENLCIQPRELNNNEFKM